jgi:hypothetical protein
MLGLHIQLLINVNVKFLWFQIAFTSSWPVVADRDKYMGRKLGQHAGNTLAITTDIKHSSAHSHYRRSLGQVGMFPFLCHDNDFLSVSFSLP